MTATRSRAARSALFALLTLFATVCASPVGAAEPPILGGRLTDTAERLVGEEERVRAALDDLRDRREITLYVVTLDEIDGQDPATFADGIAAANDLGPRDGVLIVSFGDRQFGMWTGRELDVAPERIDELLVVLGDDLRGGDVAGGIIRAAENLERLVDGLPVGEGGATVPTDEPMETAPGESFPDEPEPSFDEGTGAEVPFAGPGAGIGGGAGMFTIAIIGAGVVVVGLLLGVRRRGGRAGTWSAMAATSDVDAWRSSADPTSTSSPSTSSDSGTPPTSSGSGHGGGSSSGGSW